MNSMSNLRASLNHSIPKKKDSKMYRNTNSLQEVLVSDNR